MGDPRPGHRQEELQAAGGQPTAAIQPYRRGHRTVAVGDRGPAHVRGLRQGPHLRSEPAEEARAFGGGRRLAPGQVRNDRETSDVIFRTHRYGFRNGFSTIKANLTDKRKVNVYFLCFWTNSRRLTVRHALNSLQNSNSMVSLAPARL